MRTRALAFAVITMVAGCTAPQSPPSKVETSAEGPAEVFVFSRTAGYRHDSIAAGQQALKSDPGLAVTVGEEFPTSLDRFKAVVFLNTTGEVLRDADRAALEAFVRRGGGFAGVHSASDTEYEWPFYGELVGARFARHPAIARATVVVADQAHPATSGLPARWSLTDEWYDFKNQHPGTHILLRLDESSYPGGEMGADHPIAWCRKVDAGRSFYTGIGHTTEIYSDPLYRRHLLAGVRYAAGLATADCAPAKSTPLLRNDFSGWRFVGGGKETDPSPAFTMRDGVVQISGAPAGYLASRAAYKNFSLRYDWRFRDAAGGNSGLLIFIQRTDHPGDWPPSVEVQGMQSEHGATFPIAGGSGTFTSDKAAIAKAVRPGGWNTTEVVSLDGNVTVTVNGVRVASGHSTDPAGPIGWQSEGAELYLRNIEIVER